MSVKSRQATKQFLIHAPNKGFNPALLDKAILLNPDFKKLNVFNGRNDRLLHAVMCAYAKHSLGYDEIGWEKLGEILHSVICNEIGDLEYMKWADQFSNE